jgi:hypothetical protein
MHCGRVSNLLSAYIDRELAGTEMLQIRHHLESCSGCSAHHEALGHVKSLLGAAAPLEPHGDMAAAVMRRWEHRQQQAAAPPVRRPWSWKWFEDAQRWNRYSLALTSACLVLALAGTAMALRSKPKYADAVAANVWPVMLQPDESLPPLEPYAPRPERWTSEERWPRVESRPSRGDFWWHSSGGTVPMLVSDSVPSPYWFGR